MVLFLLIGFKKFIPCSHKSSAQNGSSLRSFSEMVGVAAILYSDSHNNFSTVFSNSFFGNCGSRDLSYTRFERI